MAQKKYLLEAIDCVHRAGGTPVSLVCDNCTVNQHTYHLLGGLGKIIMQPNDTPAVLTYDYVYVFKNVRNNWITEPCKELTFTFEGLDYIACWNDLVKLYEVDRRLAICMTKRTHTSMFSKPLQRQGVVRFLMKKPRPHCDP